MKISSIRSNFIYKSFYLIKIQSSWADANYNRKEMAKI